MFLQYTVFFFYIVDAFVDFGIAYVTNDVGSCKPVYDMYSAFTITFCDNLLGPINSIWTSIGVAIFFLLPGMVMARCIIVQYNKTLSFCDPYTDEDSSILRRSVSNYGKQHNQGTRGKFAIINISHLKYIFVCNIWPMSQICV